MHVDIRKSLGNIKKLLYINLYLWSLTYSASVYSIYTSKILYHYSHWLGTVHQERYPAYCMNKDNNINNLSLNWKGAIFYPDNPQLGGSGFHVRHAIDREMLLFW